MPQTIAAAIVRRLQEEIPRLLQVLNYSPTTLREAVSALHPKLMERYDRLIPPALRDDDFYGIREQRCHRAVENFFKAQDLPKAQTSNARSQKQKRDPRQTSFGDDWPRDEFMTWIRRRAIEELEWMGKQISDELLKRKGVGTA